MLETAMDQPRPTAALGHEPDPLPPASHVARLAVTRPLTCAYYVIPSVDALAAFDEHPGAMPVVGVEGGA
jgi:hypothetical protein